MSATDRKAPRVEDLDVMLHLDGELSADETSAVEAALLADADVRAKSTSLGQVSDILRGQFELATDDVEIDSAAMWKTIAGQLGSSEVTPHVDNFAAPEPATSAGFWQGVVAWFEEYRSYMVTGVVSAAATSIILLAITRDSGKPAVGSGNSDVASQQKAAPTKPVMLHLTSQPVEVESLEVYEGSGPIITLPGDDGQESTSVIWLSPEDVEEIEKGPI